MRLHTLANLDQFCLTLPVIEEVALPLAVPQGDAFTGFEDLLRGAGGLAVLRFLCARVRASCAAFSAVFPGILLPLAKVEFAIGQCLASLPRPAPQPAPQRIASAPLRR
jgi:hypothetical protein